MRPRMLLSITFPFVLLTVHVFTQVATRQNVELLTAGPVRIEAVKEGLYVIRGPFVPCTTRGCRPNGPDDGLVHEPGDVAARVTNEGVILIDDKYPENVSDVLAALRSVTTQPVRYLLNTHHHADHAGGNGNFGALGIDILGHRTSGKTSCG